MGAPAVRRSVPGRPVGCQGCHRGSFNPWAFTAIIILKPQLFLDFPNLRVMHQGSLYHYDPITQRLAMDDVAMP